MLRTFLPAIGIIAALIGPALAQTQTPDVGASTGIPYSMVAPPTPEQIEKRKADDRDYDKAIQKIPDKKGSNDPWSDVRSTSAAPPPKKKPPPAQQQPQQ